MIYICYPYIRHTVSSNLLTQMTIENPKSKSQYAKQLDGDSTRAPIAEKNKIHSILTALPLLMVIIGVAYYMHGEKRQAESELVMSESSQHDVVVEHLTTGQQVIVSLAPTVPGSHIKWLYQVRHEGVDLLPSRPTSP